MKFSRLLVFCLITLFSLYTIATLLQDNPFDYLLLKSYTLMSAILLPVFSSILISHCNKPGASVCSFNPKISVALFIWNAFSLLTFLMNAHDFPSNSSYASFSLFYLIVFNISFLLIAINWTIDVFSDYEFYQEFLQDLKYIIPIACVSLIGLAYILDYFEIHFDQAQVSLWGLGSMDLIIAANFFAGALYRTKIYYHSISSKSKVALLLMI